MMTPSRLLTLLNVVLAGTLLAMVALANTTQAAQQIFDFTVQAPSARVDGSAFDPATDGTEIRLYYAIDSSIVLATTPYVTVAPTATAIQLIVNLNPRATSYNFDFAATMVGKCDPDGTGPEPEYNCESGLSAIITRDYLISDPPAPASPPSIITNITHTVTCLGCQVLDVTP